LRPFETAPIGKTRTGTVPGAPGRRTRRSAHRRDGIRFAIAQTAVNPPAARPACRTRSSPCTRIRARGGACSGRRSPAPTTNPAASRPRRPWRRSSRPPSRRRVLQEDVERLVEITEGSTTRPPRRRTASPLIRPPARADQEVSSAQSARAIGAVPCIIRPLRSRRSGGTARHAHGDAVLDCSRITESGPSATAESISTPAVHGAGVHTMRPSSRASGAPGEAELLVILAVRGKPRPPPRSFWTRSIMTTSAPSSASSRRFRCGRLCARSRPGGAPGPAERDARAHLRGARRSSGRHGCM